ncbi:unnamed protein product [Nippostrongylus brasiliensis]|uniref:Uncharacterized protein n=1 Tax=Nippostrongylus brasiliensis TaxID=27835 RepID=A0A0N4YLR0_NIPBR|nr:unnamed protein product [Nippostrongylus brasiliensis]
MGSKLTLCNSLNLLNLGGFSQDSFDEEAAVRNPTYAYLEIVLATECEDTFLVNGLFSDVSQTDRSLVSGWVRIESPQTY